MLGYQIQCFEVMLCCQGFWAETHVCIILAACAGQILRTQTCLCIHMILPKKPNFILSIFASIFISNTSILDLLSYVYALELLFHMFNCLFAFHMLELGFICDFFFFLISSTRIHMFMHDVIGVELLQVIHQYKHAFYW